MKRNQQNEFATMTLHLTFGYQTKIDNFGPLMSNVQNILTVSSTGRVSKYPKHLVNEGKSAGWICHNDFA